MSIQIPWPVYVVSLRSAVERRARCVEILGRLGISFEFFDAVEGAALSEAEIGAVYDAGRNAREYKRPLSRGEIGCFLSHYELWKRIAAGTDGGAVILEDDFEAGEGLAQLLREICAAPLENCMVKLFAQRLAGGPQVAVLSSGYRLVMPDRVPGQTLGYTVDRAAAAALAALAVPFGRPVDMEIKHWWQFDVPVLVVQPTALRVNLAKTGSGIEAERKKTRPGGGLSWITRTARNLRYQWAYNVSALQAAGRAQKFARRFRARIIQQKREERPGLP